MPEAEFARFKQEYTDIFSKHEKEMAPKTKYVIGRSITRGALQKLGKLFKPGDYMIVKVEDSPDPPVRLERKWGESKDHFVCTGIDQSKLFRMNLIRGNMVLIRLYRKRRNGEMN